MRTALYRHFDAAGALLYVGISLNSIQRTMQHKHGARWFEQIARIDIQWLKDRAAALTAEAIAIASEAPRFNLHRPEVDSLVRSAPIPSETNEVKVRGEALHPVLWTGKQWAVTEHGIEARDGRYAIEKRRLRESEPAYSWVQHLSGKLWVDLDDFRLAFAVAVYIHRRERFVMPQARQSV